MLYERKKRVFLWLIMVLGMIWLGIASIIFFPVGAHAATEYSQLYIGADIGEASGYPGLLYLPASTSTKDYNAAAFTITNTIDRVAIPVPPSGCDVGVGMSIAITTSPHTDNTLSALVSSTTDMCVYSISGGAGLTAGVVVSGLYTGSVGSKILVGSSFNQGHVWDTTHGDSDYFSGGYAFQLCSSSVCDESFTLPSPDTRVISYNSPENGSSTTTIPALITFDFDYYSGVPFVDKVGYQLEDILNGIAYNTASSEVDIVVSGQDNYVATSSLPYGSYRWRAYMRDSAGTTTDAYVYGSWQEFGVGVAFSGGFFDVPNSTSTAAEMTLECEEGNIVSTSICNVLAWLFVPSSGVLDKFSSTWESIEYKPPFGYVTVYLAELTSVTATTTTAFSLTSIPLIDEIFDPFYTLLAIALWFIYLIFFTRRVVRIDL